MASFFNAIGSIFGLGGSPPPPPPPPSFGAAGFGMPLLGRVEQSTGAINIRTDFGSQENEPFAPSPFPPYFYPPMPNFYSPMSMQMPPVRPPFAAPLKQARPLFMTPPRPPQPMFIPRCSSVAKPCTRGGKLSPNELYLLQLYNYRIGMLLSSNAGSGINSNGSALLENCIRSIKCIIESTGSGGVGPCA